MSGFNDVRLSLSSVVAIVVIASAAAFAAGRSTSGSPGSSDHAIREAAPEPRPANEAPVPFNAPAGDLPPGHPPVDPGTTPAAPQGAEGHEPEDGELSWKVPPRWEVAANTSSMRLATYRIPRADGDAADGDVSVMRAGGSVQANVDRWIGQFGADAQGRAKKTTKKQGALEVTVVDVEGTYGGGMGGKPEPGWALLGAIVATPGMPYFFKITGPAKTVGAARRELDALLASITSTARP